MEIQISNFTPQHYICDNCATFVVAPHGDASAQLILDDGKYYWKINDQTIEFDCCCDHPYIEEIH